MKKYYIFNNLSPCPGLGIVCDFPKMRVPWVDCPKCGKWGSPLPFLEDMDPNPSGGSYLSPIRFAQIYPPNTLPGSIDFRNAVFKEVPGFQYNMITWINVIYPLMQTTTYEHIFSEYSDQVVGIMINKSKYTMIFPKYEMNINGIEGVSICELCGKGRRILPTRDSLDIGLLSGTFRILVSEEFRSKLLLKLPWLLTNEKRDFGIEEYKR